MDHQSRKPVLLNSEINQNPEKSYFGSLIRLQHRRFPGGSGVKTLLPPQGAGVPSLVQGGTVWEKRKEETGKVMPLQLQAQKP